MAEFSTTRKRGDFCAPCQQANLFAAHFPQGGPTLEGSVGGLSTPIALGGSICPLQNTLDGTTGALSIKVNGENKTIIDDLSQFRISKPQDVGAYFETVPIQKDTKYEPKGRLMEYAVQTTSQVESDDVIIIAVDDAMKNSTPTEGSIDIETADDSTIEWLAVSIAKGLNIIDNVTGLESLKSMTGGGVDFTMTGTNTVPLALELGDMLKRKENRQFLREILKHNTQIGKIWTNSAGNLMVSFRGYAGLRPFLSGTKYLAKNTKLSVITTAVQNSRQWAGTLKSVGGRIPVISYVIVGAIDVAEWLAMPEVERDLSDLMATLFVDISKIAISTLAGTFFAMGSIVLAGLLGVSAPVLGVVVAGIGVAVVVGMVLDSVDGWFDISGRTMELFDNIGQGASSFFDWVQESYEESVSAVSETVNEINRQLSWFDSLSDLEQYDLLSRMFGGSGYRGPRY